MMAWIIGTAIQARAVITRLNAALGLPRAAVEADRVGGGIHVPLEHAGTLRWAFLARLSDGRVGVRIKQAFTDRLTAAQRAAIAADLPVGVTITREDEV